jgi:gliding motility-associated-like protein
MPTLYYFLLTVVFLLLTPIKSASNDIIIFKTKSIPNIQFSLSDTIICPYDSAVFTALMPGVPITTVGEFTFDKVGSGGGGDTYNIVNGIKSVYLKEAGTYEISRIRVYENNVLVYDNDTSILFNLYHHFLPTVSIIGGGSYCMGDEISPLELRFSGEAPYTLTFVENGSSTITRDYLSNTVILSDSADMEVNLLMLSDKNCSTSVDGYGHLMVSELPEAAIFGDTVFCPEENAVYSTYANSSYRYRWNVPVGAELINNGELDASSIALKWVNPGVHTISLIVEKNGTGCKTGPLKQDILVYAPATVKNNYDTVVCFGEAGVAELTASIVGENTVYWPDYDQFGLTLEIFQEGTYRYQETIPFGCRNDGEITVIEKCIPEVYVAEAFTPNGDNINDLLEIHGLFYNLLLTIYNSSGEKVYVMSTNSEPWDGKINGSPAPNGVYYWTAEYTDKLGDTYFSQGNVMIIR